MYNQQYVYVEGHRREPCGCSGCGMLLIWLFIIMVVLAIVGKFAG